MNAKELLQTRDLGQRLSEAEATIKALLSGQIDAVVDPKSKTPVLLAKAQGALRESEERLRHERDRAQQYLDTAEIILLALDLDGRVTLVNRYACFLLGWTSEEVLGRDWIETFVPARIRDALRKAINNLLGGDTSVIENPILTRSGEERLIEWRSRVLRDDSGQVIGAFSSGADITERHQAVEALRTSEERMRFALEAARVGIWDTDCATGAVRWSEILESQYGLQPGTFGGTFNAFIERIQVDDRAAVIETVGKAMKAGADFSVLNRTIWPDGTVRWLGGAGRFYLGELGEPVRGVGISQDVTEERYAEAALQESTAELVERTKVLEQQAVVLTEQAALLDLAQDAIVVRDMHNRILLWNRGAEIMYGWPSKEALGRNKSELLRTEFSEPIEDIDAEFMRQGQWEGEVVHHTRDGTRVIVASRWTLQRDADGAPVRILTINNDITQRKEAEADLRTAKDAAEAANHAKSEFLANMSHEIRTPMNGVIGMTDLVLDTELTTEQREYLGIVKSSAAELLAVINDILDFSRVEAGKLELDPIDFNPRDAIGDTAHTVALRAHQKGLELLVDVGTAVPQTLRGDPGRLRQILVNLLGNAVKFTHEGQVLLRVTREAATPPDVVLHFAIKDTGVGIPLDRQKSIFEAFTQVDGTTTRAYGGTGLGLTISSQLVQMMGGCLWVESEAGRGSTFHFTASFELAKAPAALATVPEPVDLSEMRVLVVDDNATNRRLLEEMVIGWRMVPTLAACVPEALAALHGAQESGMPFRLVLTDFQMPDANGFTLAEIIKKDPASAGTAIVMLTSAGQPGDAARCRELGIAAYLPKPVKRSELHGAIMLALGAPSAERDRPVLVTRHFLREAEQAGRILLVEDNRVNQLVAKRLLEKRGYTVVVANNGREALAILDDAASVGFGCVLMDLQMPEMGGFECTAIIREREQVSGSHLPIIAMTAHAMKGDDVRCLAAGMDAYLSKPIHPDKLFDVIDAHLNGARVPVPANPGGQF